MYSAFGLELLAYSFGALRCDMVLNVENTETIDPKTVWKRGEE